MISKIKAIFNRKRNPAECALRGAAECAWSSRKCPGSWKSRVLLVVFCVMAACALVSVLKMADHYSGVTTYTADDGAQWICSWDGDDMYMDGVKVDSETDTSHGYVPWAILFGTICVVWMILDGVASYRRKRRFIKDYMVTHTAIIKDKNNAEID